MRSHIAHERARERLFCVGLIVRRKARARVRRKLGACATARLSGINAHIMRTMAIGRELLGPDLRIAAGRQHVERVRND